MNAEPCCVNKLELITLQSNFFSQLQNSILFIMYLIVKGIITPWSKKKILIFYLGLNIAHISVCWLEARFTKHPQRCSKLIQIIKLSVCSSSYTDIFSLKLHIFKVLVSVPINMYTTLFLCENGNEVSFKFCGKYLSSNDTWIVWAFYFNTSIDNGWTTV